MYSTLYSITRPAVLHIDNKSALAQASDPASLDASKHVDLRAHFLRERVRDRDIAPVYVATTDNWADGLTKPLAAPAFTRFAAEVCVSPHSRTR